jgi:hypothetical protein
LKPADQVVPLFRDKNTPLTDHTIISVPVKLHALETMELMVPDWIDAHEVPLLVDKYPNVFVPIRILVASFERQMGKIPNPPDPRKKSVKFAQVFP